MPNRIITPPVGTRYHRLKFLEDLGKLPLASGLRRFWLFECDCGAIKQLQPSPVILGTICSCGCWRRDRLGAASTKHGYGSRNGPLGAEFTAYRSMSRRCHEEKNKSFEYYSRRGIVVCEQWRDPEGFPSFLKDIGPRPGPSYTVERIDNDRGYEPGNVKWATMEQQNRNKINNVYHTFGDERLCIGEWSRRLGVPYVSLWRWLQKKTLEEIITAKGLVGLLSGPRNNA
jgi:hypothetical protein